MVTLDFFSFLIMKKATRASNASPTTPPTTPPAIFPPLLLPPAGGAGALLVVVTEALGGGVGVVVAGVTLETETFVSSASTVYPAVRKQRSVAECYKHFRSMRSH